MEIDKITLEREFLDKLLSLNYLNESDWAELESLVNLLQMTLHVKFVKIFRCFQGMTFILYF